MRARQLGVLIVVASLPSCGLLVGIGDLPFPADAGDEAAALDGNALDGNAHKDTGGEGASTDAGSDAVRSDANDGSTGEAAANVDGGVCVLGTSRVGHCTLTH